MICSTCASTMIADDGGFTCQCPNKFVLFARDFRQMDDEQKQKALSRLNQAMKSKPKPEEPLG